METKKRRLPLRLALLIALPLLLIGAGLTGLHFYAENCVFYDGEAIFSSTLMAYKGPFSETLSAEADPDRLYQALYYGLEQEEERITLPGTCSPEQVQETCAALAEDYPHLAPAVGNVTVSPGDMPVAWLKVLGPIRLPAPRFFSPQATVLHVSETARDDIAESIALLRQAEQAFSSHGDLAGDPQAMTEAYRRVCDAQKAAAALGDRLVPKEELAQYAGPFDAFIAPYYRLQLDERMGLLYDALKYAYEQGETMLDLNGSYSMDEIKLALALMKADYPQFTTSGAAYSSIDSQSRTHSLLIADGISIEVPSVNWTVVTLPKVEMEPIRKNQEAIPAAQAIVDDMPAFKTEFEKAEYLYEYLVRHVAYESGGTEADDFSTNPEHFTLNAALLKQATNCDGFASALQLLLQMNGIECFKVYYNGEDVGEEVGHVWNMAKLDGQYYHMDASSGAINREDLQAWLKEEGIPQNDFAAREYFCMTTDEAWKVYDAISGQILNYLPQSGDPAIKQRVFDMVVSDSSDLMKLGPQKLAQACAAGQNYICVSFANDALFEEFSSSPQYKRYGEALTSSYSKNGWYTSANDTRRRILYGVY